MVGTSAFRGINIETGKHPPLGAFGREPVGMTFSTSVKHPERRYV
jgi:hypothetical protein